MQEMKNRTEANGGATLHLPSGEYDRYTTGYYVGGYAKAVTFPLEGSTVADYVLAAIDVISSVPAGKRTGNLGSWIDTETGTVWIDASEHYTDRTEAMRVAAERGELAIWDIANAEEIRL